MEQADVDEGHQPGLSTDERKELVELRCKNRVLEMEIEILIARENVLPKMGFRLVHELAAGGFDVAVTCRVPKVSPIRLLRTARPRPERPATLMTRICST